MAMASRLVTCAYYEGKCFERLANEAKTQLSEDVLREIFTLVEMEKTAQEF